MPPAFVTAAASFGPAATPIPASMTGCLICSKSVMVVRICSVRRYLNILLSCPHGIRVDASIRFEAMMTQGNSASMVETAPFGKTDLHWMFVWASVAFDSDSELEWKANV